MPREEETTFQFNWSSIWTLLDFVAMYEKQGNAPKRVIKQTMFDNMLDKKSV